jgi:hypothetical protein
MDTSPCTPPWRSTGTTSRSAPPPSDLRTRESRALGGGATTWATRATNNEGLIAWVTGGGPAPGSFDTPKFRTDRVRDASKSGTCDVCGSTRVTDRRAGRSESGRHFRSRPLRSYREAGAGRRAGTRGSGVEARIVVAELGDHVIASPRLYCGRLFSRPAAPEISSRRAPRPGRPWPHVRGEPMKFPTDPHLRLEGFAGAEDSPCQLHVPVCSVVVLTIDQFDVGLGEPNVTRQVPFTQVDQ